LFRESRNSHRRIDLENIYVSGQMGGFVIEKSGDFEIVSWQDQRSLLPQFKKSRIELENWLETSLAFKETGSELRPGLPFFSLAVTKPSLGESDPKSPFRSLISFVTSYLTNFETSAMHITDAASSGFFNLKTKAWDDDLKKKVTNRLHYWAPSSRLGK
jgi:xylulokinase